MECQYCRTVVAHLRSHVLRHCISFFLLHVHTAAHLFASVLRSQPGTVRGIDTLAFTDSYCTLLLTMDSHRPQDHRSQLHRHVLIATGVWYHEGPTPADLTPCIAALPATELVVSALGTSAPSLQDALAAWEDLPQDPTWVCPDPQVRRPHSLTPLTLR